MKTGFRGTFVISWTQTETDGQVASPLSALRVGAVWSWTGEAVRVDGPAGVLPLGEAAGSGELRRRAAHAVRRLLSAVEADTSALDAPPIDEPLFEAGFQVTDGRALWHVTLIEVGSGKHPLCMFAGEIPPRGTELWIVSHATLPQSAPEADRRRGLLCFATGTLIATEQGPIPVEEIALGTRVQTKDSGPMDVLWTGSRRITGARMQVMPHLAPVRIETAAAPLLVSPDHRILIEGPGARALFNTPEVLASALDLVGAPGVEVDRTLREVTYHHLLLPSHQIVFAAGVEVESFHPADGALEALSPADRAHLTASLPGIAIDPSGYGPHARRVLDAPEVALLQHEAA